MRIGKGKRSFFLTIICTFLLTGCHLKREIKVELSDDLKENQIQEYTEGEQLLIEDSVIDIERLTELLLGVSAEEAKNYIPSHYTGSNFYIKDCMELMYSENSVVFYDETDGAGSCYCGVMDPYSYLREYLGFWMRDIYPEENLDNFSKEEAILACQPYATACGYQDSDISVYAMTLEKIEDASKVGGNHSAPGPGFQYISYEDIAIAREKGDQDEVERLDEMRYSAKDRNIPWKKKDEAMLLVYRPYINGLVMDSVMQRLVMIYVPDLQKVVYMEGYCPVTAVGVQEKKHLISKEEAVSQALLTLDLEEGAVTICNISLVYSARAFQAGYGLDKRTIDPCWRIDYNADKNFVPNGSGTLLINAFDGSVSHI